MTRQANPHPVRARAYVPGWDTNPGQDTSPTRGAALFALESAEE